MQYYLWWDAVRQRSRPDPRPAGARPAREGGRRAADRSGRAARGAHGRALLPSAEHGRLDIVHPFGKAPVEPPTFTDVLPPFAELMARWFSAESSPSFQRLAFGGSIPRNVAYGSLAPRQGTPAVAQVNATAGPPWYADLHSATPYEMPGES